MRASGDEVERRLKDIRAIKFSDHPVEIAATLQVVLSCYEVDDDPAIIGLCKEKLNEGVGKLQKMGETALAREFRLPEAPA